MLFFFHIVKKNDRFWVAFCAVFDAKIISKLKLLIFCFLFRFHLLVSIHFEIWRVLCSFFYCSFSGCVLRQCSIIFMFDFGAILRFFWKPELIILGIDFWCSFWMSFQERSRAAKSRPRAAKSRPRAAKSRSRAAKSCPRAASAPRAANSAPGAARERHKSCQERPKSGQEHTTHNKQPTTHKTEQTKHKTTHRI